MTIPIRQANSGDQDTILALDLARFDPISPAHTGDWLGADRSAWIDKWIAAGECYLVHHDGIAAGYGVFHYHFFHDGMIDMLIVAHAWRRHGIARALVRYFAAQCRTEKIWCSTNLSNQIMQTLLAAEGLRMSGFIENLDEGDPELIYFRKSGAGSYSFQKR